MSELTTKTVLIVEDDKTQADAMQQALQGAGFSTFHAPAVRDAIFKLKNQKYSCIVVDILLGGENGGELIDLIRTRKDFPSMESPIFVVSANLSKETLQSLAGKVQGAMVKPVDMAAFTAQVQKLAK